MMNFIVVLATLFAAASADVFPPNRFWEGPITEGGGGGGGRGFPGPIIASKRDGLPADTDEVYQAIHTALDLARQGVAVSDLDSAMKTIQENAASVINANGGSVDVERATALIREVEMTLHGATGISSLFEGQLQFDASRLDTALYLLNGLMTKAMKIEADEDPINDVMGAISMTALAIHNVLVDAVHECTILINDQRNGPEGDERKPWELTGVAYGDDGPTLICRPSQERGKRQATKHDWSIKTDLGYDSKGFKAGVTLTYSWGRKK